MIPQVPLIAAVAWGNDMPAARVAKAIARGWSRARRAGRAPADECPLECGERWSEEARLLLEEVRFDGRMRRARAVILASSQLQEETLAGTVVFEIATRARQAGVPAYAVTASNSLNAFDARMLDLQLVVEARDERSLVAAGRRLAEVV